MSVVICGSMAYDTIMVYPGYFKNEILPDKVHILNVSFLVPQMRREFGGCAGNISYNLKLLGGNPLPLGCVGADFAPYASWLDRNGISRELLLELSDAFTSQCYITTDLDDNQITAFHPGAMSNSHQQAVPVRNDIHLGSISPDGRDGMLVHAQQFLEAGIPYLFDPGQAMPLFSGDELKAFIRDAAFVALNDYEAELLMSRTGWTLRQVADHVKALFVTRGAKGSHIYTDGKTYDIPCAKAESLADPTGCGDAYRAGLMFSMTHGLDWETAGRVASLMGAIKIERVGPQNHKFTLESFARRFRREFGYDLGLPTPASA